MPRTSHKNKKYSKELKMQAVQDYLSGGGSLREICKKHEIKDKHTLMDWIMWYNGHKEIKERFRKRRNIYDQGKKNHTGRTSRNSSILHRTRKKLWVNSRNIRSFISTDICLGKKIRGKRCRRINRQKRQSKA
ncbi:MAG: transposase [Ruminococcaceae bacterium]|nr:transposase [Oscillospiraceae bacterium]